MVAVAWYVSKDDDVRRIEKRLDELHGVLEKEATVSALNMLAASRRVQAFFTTNATVRIPSVSSRTLSRPQLPPLLYQVHSQTDSLAIDIRDQRVTLNTTNSTLAEMNLSALARARYGGRNETRVQEFRLRWLKVKGRWYIDEVAGVDGIRRPRSVSP